MKLSIAIDSFADVFLRFEDEAAHFRHILEARDAGINIPINGSKDLSFQVGDCVCIDGVETY